MVELITKQSALDAIDKESEFIEREINDATKHPDEYTDNFISFSRERQSGLADAYIAVDELSPVETMTDDDIISRQAAVEKILRNKDAKPLNESDYQDGIRAGLDIAYCEIRDLPSAEPVNKDAISREGLLKSWNELSIRGRTEFDQVIMTIPALPSADRPTGKWIDVSGSWCANEECSLCGEIVHEYNYNYCPNCGAKMG